MKRSADPEAEEDPDPSLGKFIEQVVSGPTQKDFLHLELLRLLGQDDLAVRKGFLASATTAGLGQENQGSVTELTRPRLDLAMALHDLLRDMVCVSDLLLCPCVLDLGHGNFCLILVTIVCR